MTFTLRDYQEDAVAGIRAAFRNYQSVLLTLATGAGKCFAKDTPIMMFDGSIKLVQDICVGDLLMGPDSKPRRVESLARGSEMMYRVTPIKGDSYVVNEGHILSLKITGMGGKRVKAGDGRFYQSGDICNITVSDYLKSSSTFKHCAKGWRVGVAFSGGEKLPVPAWVLGAWLGDGSTGKSSFTTGDHEIAQEIIAYGEKIGMTIRAEKNSEGSVNIHLKTAGVAYGRGGSPFCNALRQIEVLHDKHIPHQYKTSSREDRLELLAGILDTDGYYDGRCYNLTFKSERLIDDTIFVARSLGFACYKSKVMKKCYNNGVIGEYFSCCISGEISEIPCRLERHNPGDRRQKKNHLLTGISVEQVGVGDYYGFTLSGADRLFLLGDFTVAHNTVVFSYIAKAATAKNNNVLILAHRDQLIKQASNKLRDYGVDHGIIMAGFTPKPHAKVQVASVQTLVRRLEKIRFEPNLIVIDEAHLSAAESYRKVLARWPNALVLGVTGSPCRLDNKSLGRNSGGIYDHLVQGVSIKNLISRGFLVRPVVYAPREQIDLSGIKKSKGDYDTTELAAAVDKPMITGNAVDHYRRICNGVPAVAWCVTVAHATHVANEFRASGIAAEMLCGEHDSAHRDKVLAKLTSGEIKVVTFVGILIEGVDCPAIGAIIMLRPTLSLSSYLQVIGRGLRPLPGKSVCFVLDHAGLSFRHGLADEEREWSLDEGEKKKAKKKKAVEEVVDVKQCPKCFIVHEPAPICPGCGHVYETKVRKLEYAEGELQEITPEIADRMRKQKRSEVGKARSYEELLEIEKQRGYKPGWARLVFQSRQRKAGVR